MCGSTEEDGIQNPDTQKSTPWCRHEWVQQLVIRQR
jgi:hypothetical protein